ncbi:hypothetical protein M0Q50_01310 [bacterium]|jgi:hypothetical protein|nr:hypothetical protein [bacterium]
MNEYNEKWTREKFIEYRKLKRNGYSHDQLKEHFGDDIWHSGLYNKNAPPLLPYFNFINEIKITPFPTEYKINIEKSYLKKEKFDFILNFTDNNIEYVLMMMYFNINNIDTYNIIFTTKQQYNLYEKQLKIYSIKNNITIEEHEILSNILEKTTNFNRLYQIIKKLSFILFDFCENRFDDIVFSIGDTKDDRKIKLYRNVIKDSFENIIETEDYENNNLYYLYEIK